MIFCRSDCGLFLLSLLLLLRFAESLVSSFLLRPSHLFGWVRLVDLSVLLILGLGVLAVLGVLRSLCSGISLLGVLGSLCSGSLEGRACRVGGSVCWARSALGSALAGLPSSFC